VLQLLMQKMLQQKMMAGQGAMPQNRPQPIIR
jgi:hypothetical protein